MRVWALIFLLWVRARARAREAAHVSVYACACALAGADWRTCGCASVCVYGCMIMGVCVGCECAYVCTYASIPTYMCACVGACAIAPV